MNVLIVDDQERILEATKKLVDWEKLGVDQVFTANSAAYARKILDVERIDIMLADIEMPGENGIELQKWQSREHPETACIFLTSHADFTYAQEAIRGGAFGYILQPASIPEIEETLEKCISRLKEREVMVKKSARYDQNQGELLETQVMTMFHQRSRFANMESWRTDSGTAGEDWWYQPCLMELWNGDAMKLKPALEEMGRKLFGIKKIHYVSCCVDEKRIGILLYGCKIPLDSMELKEKCYYILEQVTAGTGGEANLYVGAAAGDDLPQRIQEIFDFCRGRLLKKNEVYMTEKQKVPELRRPSGVVWSRWLIRGDLVLVKNQITNLLSYAQENNQLTIGYMQEIIHAFLEACSVACYNLKRPLGDLFTDRFAYEDMLRSYSSAEELKKGVDICLRQYERLLPETQGEENAFSARERIQEIKNYLDEHMDRMISRREAAKYLFLNEDYFSRMFRKEVGMGYKEYVLKIKMEYAGRLLSATDFPVTLIASKIGYENFTNFSKMFRKVTGMTPTDYRRTKKENSPGGGRPAE